MTLIEITDPLDYFQISIFLNNTDNWTFIFRWNETYQLFYVDFYLNNTVYKQSVPVLGGVPCFENYSLGYNFTFTSTVAEPYVVTDLGTNILMYQITEDDAVNIGIWKT